MGWFLVPVVFVVTVGLVALVDSLWMVFPPAVNRQQDVAVVLGCILLSLVVSAAVATLRGGGPRRWALRQSLGTRMTRVGLLGLAVGLLTVAVALLVQGALPDGTRTLTVVAVGLGVLSLARIHDGWRARQEVHSRPHKPTPHRRRA